MEATSLRPSPALNRGSPVNAARRAGWRRAPPRTRLSVVARLEGGLGKGVPTTNYVVPLDKPTGMTRPLVEILRDLNKRVPDKIIDPETNTVPWYHANRMLSFYAPEILRFISLNRKKTSGLQPPEGGTHTHTTVLTKRLQLGKEVPSTTNRNDIRPRLALPPTKNGEAERLGTTGQRHRRCQTLPGWCGEVRDVIYSNSGTVTVVYRVILKGTDGEAFRDATGTAKVHEGRSDDAVAAAEETAFSKACARFGFGLYLYHQDEIP